MPVTYRQDIKNVNWEALRASLIEDNFHNGRTAEQYRRSFENSQEVVFAWDNDRIVGTARLLSDGVCNAYIIDVWTHSAYRRQGIARYMLHLLEAEAQGQHISLWTDSAQPFYERIGYHRSADTLYEKVVGTWLDGSD
ncbi:MAG: GNAT family N-acetyltransferase [bacterium]|nr:GNAT family N-acetyltransferase [bacterium]